MDSQKWQKRKVKKDQIFHNTMSSEISPTSIIYTGYFYSVLNRILNGGKLFLFKENNEKTSKLKEELDKIQPIYNTKGRLIEHENSGKYLDFLVWLFFYFRNSN